MVFSRLGVSLFCKKIKEANMGCTTSISPQEARSRQATRLKEKAKKHQDSKREGLPCCDFCGALAKHLVIRKEDDSRILSCYTCVPKNGDGLDWVKCTQDLKKP
jgi:hypothetical protein